VFSRLAAMERADKNIDELLETLHGTFHRIRQAGIDEELFDVISGFEALTVDEDSPPFGHDRSGFQRREIVSAAGNVKRNLI
jgi:hypothetical protein